jgi:formylglycine-generating enzyme required for sulfatase activity
MMRVEGGTFMMGAMEDDARANANEKPAHEVTLTYDYYMGQTEVTQGLWKAVMGSDNNPSTMKGDDLPVNNVLWGDARAFVYKLNQMTGLSFDLPTEAEWQFAARGGNRSKGYLYAGSDNVRDVAWYSSNSGGVTHTVETKQPNELGIYDMSGNVFEWCSDWYSSSSYSSSSQTNPQGPSSGSARVLRGGSWNSNASCCHVANRNGGNPSHTRYDYGFRVVCLP